MPCNGDYLNSTKDEIELSGVQCLLDELDGQPINKNYFPLLISYQHNRKYIESVVNDSKDLPNGIPFKVLETNTKPNNRKTT